MWLIASGLFAAYVANFGSYNKTYGALGAVIIFLVWMWITNLAVLIGAEFNAELERGRELESGQPEAARELQLPPRDAPKPRRSLLERLRTLFGKRRDEPREPAREHDEVGVGPDRGRPIDP